MEYIGKIQSSGIYEYKFPISGKLSKVLVKRGQKVNSGELLASLDKKELQAYLDRALKEYDLERANFDEKQKGNPSEYEKRKFQDELDISVKNVEIAKANLDSTDLYSSTEGIILNSGSSFPGENITPAAFVISVLNPKSLMFVAEVPEDKFSGIEEGKIVSVILKAFPEKIFTGKIESLGLEAIKEGIFPIYINLTENFNLRIGLTGKAII